MDVWKAKEVKCMELGGNKRAREFYENNNMVNAEGGNNHASPKLAKYKADLARRAEQSLGMSSQNQPATHTPAFENPTEKEQV